MKNVADQNQICAFYESGTYATSSGAAFWIGMVQNHEVDENMGVINVRYAGAASRNVSQFVDGPAGYTGTIEYYPQDFRMLKFALGQCADAGSPSPYTHTYTESDSNETCPEIASQPLASMTIEDFQGGFVAGSNFVRTINGAVVDSFSMDVPEGGPISCSVGYTAQTLTFGSGAKSSVTALTTMPFMQAHTKLNIPSGTAITNLKTVKFSIANNLNAPYYINNTRNIGTPIPVNRDYEVSLTLNADSAFTKTFYDQYFLGGSTFNAILDSTASAGSRILIVTMSGCKITDMSAPSPNEGVDEQTITIVPQTVDAVETSTVQYYNAGSYA